MVLDPNQKKDRIETLKDVLYSKDENNLLNRRRHVLKSRKDSYDTPTSWKEEDKKALRIPYEKILLGTFIFFVLALGFTFFKFFGGSNIISGNNIDILVSGPVSVSGGEEFSLDIEVKNNNNTDLQVVDLQIEFPDGTRDPENLSTELKRYSVVMGDIKIGKSERKNVKAILFGEENTQKSIIINVDYRVPDSNAVFSKKKEYIILINSSPVNISIIGPDEINANQQVDYEVNISSNSVTLIKNLVLKVDYPFGLNIVSTIPESDSKNRDVFQIGDLEPTGKRKIKISGIMQGQDGEHRVLKFTVGNPDNNDDSVIISPFAFVTKDINIKESFVTLDFSFNGLYEDNVSLPNGSKVDTLVFWRNNMPDKIYNMAITMKITGISLDKNTMNVANGYYDSLNDLILFNKNYIKEFEVLKQADSGNLKFDFEIFSFLAKPNVSFNNSSIKIVTTVTGSLTESSNSYPETLLTDERIIKISSNLRLISKAYKSIGPFENFGPIPPRVNNESSYTITWTATNSFNNIKNTEVSALLPSNVSWKGLVSPDIERIYFDQKNNKVVWDIGDMKMDTGQKYEPRTVSFQVSIIPSTSNIGDEIVLLEESTITGIDSYSGAKLSEIKPSITTKIVSDPEFFNDIGKVIE